VLAGDLAAAGYAVSVDGEQDTHAVPGASSDLGGRGAGGQPQPQVGRALVQGADAGDERLGDVEVDQQAGDAGQRPGAAGADGEQDVLPGGAGQRGAAPPCPLSYPMASAVYPAVQASTAALSLARRAVAAGVQSAEPARTAGG